MPDGTRDQIQRALNEEKRKELEERYGARFSFDAADAPPAVIAGWLEAVEEFERRLSCSGRTTVRSYAGDPDSPAPSSLPGSEISRELRRLMECLHAHAIAVHFDRTVSAAEAYRFIVEELFPLEIDDVRIDGLVHNFVYGDFHPDGRD